MPQIELMWDRPAEQWPLEATVSFPARTVRRRAKRSRRSPTIAFPALLLAEVVPGLVEL